MRIAAAMPNVIGTSTGASALRRMWRNMIRAWLGAHRPGRGDEFHLLELEELGPRQPGDARPAA